MLLSSLCCSIIEHRQSRVSIIIKGPGVIGMVNRHCLLFKVTALASNKRVSLSFEALKPVIDFSSLAMKVLDGIFFHYKAVSSTLKICGFV